MTIRRPPGARSFIEDTITGVFLLLENHIRAGDVCDSSIRRLANVTRGYSCFLLDLPVAIPASRPLLDLHRRRAPIKAVPKQ